MEYISAEEFLKQTKEVQNVFHEWWEPKESDLYFHEADNTVVECFNCEHDGLYISHRSNVSYREDMSPIFTEGQLRKFIEDKTGNKVTLVQPKTLPIEIWLYTDKGIKIISSIDKFNVLQAYWKVALEIAKEKVK
jgi:hypothetical protein